MYSVMIEQMYAADLALSILGMNDKYLLLHFGPLFQIVLKQSTVHFYYRFRQKESPSDIIIYV